MNNQILQLYCPPGYTVTIFHSNFVIVLTNWIIFKSNDSLLFRYYYLIFHS